MNGRRIANNPKKKERTRDRCWNPNETFATTMTESKLTGDVYERVVNN